MNLLNAALIILLALAVLKIGGKILKGFLTIALFLALAALLAWLLKYGVRWG